MSGSEQRLRAAATERAATKSTGPTKRRKQSYAPPSQAELMSRCVTDSDLKPKVIETWFEVLFELFFSEDMGAILLIFVLYTAAYYMYYYP